MKRALFLSTLAALSLVACTQRSSSNPAPLPPDFTPLSLPQEWTPTPSEPTPIPGWDVFVGEGVELALPSNFEGGDPTSRREELLELIRALGPEYESYADTVTQNPSGMVFIAFDRGSAGSIVNVTRREIPPEMTMEEYLNGLLSAFVEQIPGTSVIQRSGVQRGKDRVGRVILEFDTGEAISRQLSFVILKSGRVWTVSYAAPLERFEEMLPIFELSMITFEYLP